MLQLECPYCRGSFEASPELVEQQVTCPICGGLVLIAGDVEPPRPPDYSADDPPLPPPVPDVETPDVPRRFPPAPPGTDLPTGSPPLPLGTEPPPSGLLDEPVQMPDGAPAEVGATALQTDRARSSETPASATRTDGIKRPIAVTKPRSVLPKKQPVGQSAQRTARRRVQKNLIIIALGMALLISMLMLLKQI